MFHSRGAFLVSHGPNRRPAREGDLGHILQRQKPARIVRRKDLQPPPQVDLPRRTDLLGDSLRQLAPSDPERTLQTDANMPAIPPAMAPIGSWLRPAPTTDQR